MSKRNSFLITKEGLAVLLIDMQKIFIKTIPFFRKKKMLSDQIKIVRVCAKYDIPLVIVEMSIPKEKTLKVLVKETRKVPRVITIIKDDLSAFKKTGLDTYLRNKGIKNLVLMGVFADECVKSTAKDAVEKYGFKVITSSGLITKYKGTKYSKTWFKENSQFFEETGALIETIEKS